MNILKQSVVVLSALISVTTAMAQDQGSEPGYTLSYNVGVLSDYRVRGISQTSFKPALQMGIDFAHKNGLYLGAFASNVNWVKDFNGATKGSLEVDIYGGYKGVITKDVGFDIGAITYQYPGNNSGVANPNLYLNSGGLAAGSYANANTTEIYGALSYRIFNFKYNRSVGNFLGNLDSSGSQYFDLSANFDLGNGFTLTPHIGHQKIRNQNLVDPQTGVVLVSGNAADYTDYSLAIAKDFGNGLVATATAIGTNTKKDAVAFYNDGFGRKLGKSTVVLGLKYNF